MSAQYAARILELLKQLQYPGADHFTERDIEILAQHPIVKAVMIKFANLHPDQFLSKEQVDVLRLAGELNDPTFLPLDPVEIRRQTADLRKTERERKRLRMQERHRREELNELGKSISLLEEDGKLRESVRQAHERTAAALEVQAKRAEASLKAAQQDLQASTSMFKLEVQQTLKDMKITVEKVKRPGGLRSLFDSESYIAFANEIVDITETAHGMISQPEALPQKYAILVGEKKIALIRTLEHTIDSLNESCETVLESLRPLCQNSYTFAKLTETLDVYKTSLKNSINFVINQLYDTAAMINKGQLEKMLPILRNLEQVIFAHKSVLSEESKFLEETLDMIRCVHEWKQALLPASSELSCASVLRTTFQSNATMSNDMTFYPSPGLSSTMFEHHSQVQSSMNSTAFCQKSLLPAVCNPKGLHQCSYFEEILDSISRDRALFHKITDQFDSDRSVLCGTSGIQFLSESDRTQLMALSQRTISKKAELKKLIQTHEALVKDARNQNQAHFKRLLLPLYVLDRQKYEDTMRSIGLVVNIFQ
ncbi:uncharacterized protein LOC100901971 [Galendromus occidentalis]|uniref:Uncharacterized protein LOC100901971 n=1 Tax=Galendromus occidentalis TaxID=34638 RepID=A0AAJ6QSJ2_9ACAR|nr:uncharacterized protein LOC100901971 [Galendromus occidentalis]